MSFAHKKLFIQMGKKHVHQLLGQFRVFIGFVGREDYSHSLIMMKRSEQVIDLWMFLNYKYWKSLQDDITEISTAFKVQIFNKWDHLEKLERA